MLLYDVLRFSCRSKRFCVKSSSKVRKKQPALKCSNVKRILPHSFKRGPFCGPLTAKSNSCTSKTKLLLISPYLSKSHLTFVIFYTKSVSKPSLEICISCLLYIRRRQKRKIPYSQRKRHKFQ